MGIKECVKTAITRAFKNNVFRERSSEYITESLNSKYKGSSTMGIILPIPNVEVTNIDAQHDQWILVFDDLKIEAIVTWRSSVTKEGQFVLTDIQ